MLSYRAPVGAVDLEFTVPQTITSSEDFVLYLIGTNAGFSAPWISHYHDTPSPIAGDDLGGFEFAGNSSTGARYIGGYIFTKVNDPTNTLEDTQIEFWTAVGGTTEPRVIIDEGLNIYANTASNDVFLNMEFTDDSADPIYEVLFKVSSSGAAADFITAREYWGTDSVGTDTKYAVNEVVIADATNNAEYGSVIWRVMNNGNNTDRMVVTISDGMTIEHNIADGYPLSLFTSENSAAGAGFYLIRGTGSAQAADNLFSIFWRGNDSVGNGQDYGSFGMVLDDPTSGNEDSSFELALMKAGVNTTVAEIDGNGGVFYGEYYVINETANANVFGLIADHEGTEFGYFSLTKGSLSAAASDGLFTITFTSYDASDVLIDYGKIEMTILDPTASLTDSDYYIWVRAAGALCLPMYISNNEIYLNRQSDDANPTVLTLDRETGDAAAGDGLFTIQGNGRTSTDALANMLNIKGILVDATNGSLDTRWQVETRVANTMTAQITIDNGIYHPTLATGGAKGTGSINMDAVYDDNTLLTCYVFDAAIDGHIDEAKWDALAPGEPEHMDMRKFRSRMGTDTDPLNLDAYTRHWKERRHLTSMPNETKFDPVMNMPTGDWIQRLLETAEIHAVHLGTINDRLKALENLAQH